MGRQGLIRWVSLLGLGLLASCGAANSDFVVIETKDNAFTVFTPSPPNMSETLLRRIVAESAPPGKARVVPLAEFAAAVREEAGRVIERNDYPAAQVVPGIICLMRRAPGPWGITWNGGIALTRYDYDFARHSYETRAAPAGTTPVDPRVHLGPPGCL